MYNQIEKTKNVGFQFEIKKTISVSTELEAEKFFNGSNSNN